MGSLTHSLLVLTGSNTEATDRMSGILGVAEERKSDERDEEKAEGDRLKGIRGDVGVLLGVNTALVRPLSRTFGITPALTYRSWAVGYCRRPSRTILGLVTCAALTTRPVKPGLNTSAAKLRSFQGTLCFPGETDMLGLEAMTGLLVRSRDTPDMTLLCPADPPLGVRV